jgi:hypothetical protein
LNSDTWPTKFGVPMVSSGLCRLGSSNCGAGLSISAEGNSRGLYSPVVIWLSTNQNSPAMARKIPSGIRKRAFTVQPPALAVAPDTGASARCFTANR